MKWPNFLLLVFLAFLVFSFIFPFSPHSWGEERAAYPFSLPCSLQMGGRPPRLFLMEGNHTHFFNELLALDKVRQAVEGKIILGVEGIYYGIPQHRDLYLNNLKSTGFLPPSSPASVLIFGVDSPFPHGLSLLMKLMVGWTQTFLQAEGLENPEWRSQWKEDWVSLAAYNPFLQEAWRIFLSKSAGEGNEDEEDENRKWERKMREVRRQERLGSDQEFSPFTSWKNFSFFLEELLFIYVEMAKSEKYRKEMMVNTKQVELALNPFNPKAVEAVVVNWRNLFLAERILSLYCLALEEKKDLYIQIGMAHTEGLTGLLRQWAPFLPVLRERTSLDFQGIFEFPGRFLEFGRPHLVPEP